MKPIAPHGEEPATFGRVGKDGGVAVLSAAGLSVAAFAHPLLDVLADHPTFFAAHKVDALTLTVFAAIATLATATGAAVLAMVSRLAAGRLEKLLNVGLFGCLLALICDRLGRQLPVLHDSHVIAASAIMGLLIAVLQNRNDTLRFAISVVGSACLVLVPAYFLTRTLPMVSAAGDGAPFLDHALDIERPAPIVFVIFDGLRLVELLDDNGGIDEAAFPNFAKLGRKATWYRNTTTVSGFTAYAVPALLTGNFPQPHSNTNKSRGPTLAAHPANLFTMLARDYDVVADQPITDLCPANVCENAYNHRQIVRALMSDALALLPYIFGTGSYAATLPPIDTKWKGFASSGSESAANAPRQLDRARPWVDAIDRGKRPQLHFLHTLTPHKPFRYTADGLKYQQPDTRLRSTTPQDGYKWTEDVATVAFEHARYRMQTAAVDRLLGRLIERLEHLGICDETLLVVTSDHGVAFRPRSSHRHYNEALHAELFFVPLFIKAPGQTEGKIDDRPAQSIDVFPTLLELIEADHVEVDGRSLLDHHARTDERFFIPPGRRDRVAIAETDPSSLPPRAVREANEMRPRAGPADDLRPQQKRKTAVGAVKDATVIILPPSGDAAEAVDSGGKERAYFLHGIVILDDPAAGWPEVELSLADEPALLSGTFFGRETGRILFEGLVRSTEQPEVVHKTINVALRWARVGGIQERTFPRIMRTTQEADSFLTVENAFWYAFWQGHPASISCSESYRRAFLTTWRELTSESDNVLSLARLIRRSSAACSEDPESAAARASELEQTCRCEPLESELATLPSDSAETGTPKPKGPMTWNAQWDAFGFSTGCSDLVKQRFSKTYNPDSPATWVRPPFVLLRAAIESCRNDGSVGSGADPRLCECYSFEWADDHDTLWAERWDYRDPVKGPAMAVASAILDTSELIGEDLGR